MFAANVLTVWVEALQTLFHDPNYPSTGPNLPEMKDIPVLTEYPQVEANYPGLWVNYTMQGDVKNVGIGHIEQADDGGGAYEVYRWHFGGFVEITVAALGNLERALLLDELLRSIAIARVDRNMEGALREHIERSDLIGQQVAWESITVSGFGEAQGTPWGTDDVVYEATITLTTRGEVVLNPATGTLVPLSAIDFEVLREDEGPLPTPGEDGWI